jgi:hypothetical protein
MTANDILKNITAQIAQCAGMPTCNNWALQRGDGAVYDGNIADGEPIGIDQMDAPSGYIRVTSEIDFANAGVGACRGVVDMSCEFALVLWQNTNQPPTELLDKAIYDIARCKIKPSGYNHPIIEIERGNAFFDAIYTEETGQQLTTPPNGLVLAKVVFTVRVKVAYCNLTLPACYQKILTPPFVFDADALILINAILGTGATLTQPEKLAVNTWFVEMKNGGFYSRFAAGAVWLMVGGTAAAHKFNAINPIDTDAAFRLTFFGGWTHTATGALPNGINSYADSYFIPGANAAANSTAIGYYSGTNSAGSYIEMGVTGVGGNSGQGQLFIAPNVSGAGFLAVNTTGNAGIPSATPTGMFVASRNDGVNIRLHQNAAQIAISAGLPVTASDKKIYVGGCNVNNASFNSTNRECRAAFICPTGLSAADANAISQIFMDFETALGRA